MTTNSSYDNRLREAKSLYNKGLHPEALEIFESLRKEYPEKSKPVSGAGVCLFATGEHTQALGCFIKASKLAPEDVENYLNMGHCLNELGQERMALIQYETVLKIDNNNLQALTELARLYMGRNRYIEAADILKKAVAIKASKADNHGNLALALAHIGNFEEAIKHAKKAIRIEPNNQFTHNTLAQVHLLHGNQAEAEKSLNKAIEIDPHFGYSYYALVQKKITKNELPLIKKMESVLNQGMSSVERQQILYALGKAYNDIKETDKAITYIQKANALNRSVFDVKDHIRSIRQTKKFFSKQFFDRLQYHSSSPYTFIFIVGMPRSGSTLVDQILSTHSAVFSGGESLAMNDVVNEIKGKANNKTKYPVCLNEFNQQNFEYYANSYIQNFSLGANKSTHIIDKNLFNYMHLGLIAILFPNAKIIHTRRHPLDIGLSCYMTGFSAALKWSDDLTSIGKYYRNYIELMEHWHKTLPIPILDLQYEDMVEDPENNVRRILEFCDLKWEDKCLNFHQSKRTVTTASLWQVRQPVYKSSIQRWVPYAKHLQPLILALGDLLEADYEKLESLGLKHGPRHNNPLNKISKFFK